ncbi:MAG: putative secondary metabolism biosynthetic enzyme [Bathelium mastoideum]|nr:MAG: putative secondary metabolism biosynthetic enzyme [Bathelium mastoideum]
MTDPTALMNSLPGEQQALKIESRSVLSLQSSTMPSFQPDQILVRTTNIGLNPVDAKSADMSPTAGATSGSDFSGVIVAIGSMLRRPLNVGDHVFGAVFGNNPDEKENGAFAQYVVAFADLVWKVPEGMSMENASCLGMGLMTVGLALYLEMGLRLPQLPAAVESTHGEWNDDGEEQFVLVYGGGTATGMLAIQMLRLSNYVPVVICSPQSSGQCLALGASACFDYRSPTCGADVRSYTRNTLRCAFDCISTAESMKICYGSIASPVPPVSGRATQERDFRDRIVEKARYVALDPFPIRAHNRRSIHPTWILAYTILNQPVHWPRPYQREPKPQHRKWAVEVWVGLIQELLERQAIRPPRIEVRRGGLASIMDGISDVRMGRAGGRKLVYAI